MGGNPLLKAGGGARGGVGGTEGTGDRVLVDVMMVTALIVGARRCCSGL